MADNCHNGKDKAYDPEAPSSGLNSNQQREDDQDSEFDDVADEDAEIDETSGSQVQSDAARQKTEVIETETYLPIIGLTTQGIQSIQSNDQPVLVERRNMWKDYAGNHEINTRMATMQLEYMSIEQQHEFLELQDREITTRRRENDLQRLLSLPDEILKMIARCLISDRSIVNIDEGKIYYHVGHDILCFARICHRLYYMVKHTLFEHQMFNFTSAQTSRTWLQTYMDKHEQQAIDMLGKIGKVQLAGNSVRTLHTVVQHFTKLQQLQIEVMDTNHFVMVRLPWIEHIIGNLRLNGCIVSVLRSLRQVELLVLSSPNTQKKEIYHGFRRSPRGLRCLLLICSPGGRQSAIDGACPCDDLVQISWNELFELTCRLIQMVYSDYSTEYRQRLTPNGYIDFDDFITREMGRQLILVDDVLRLL